MPGTLDRMAVPKRPLTVVRRAAVASVVQGGNAGGSTPQAKQSAAGLDAIDLTIIRILQNDGRAAFTAIAKQLGISEGAVRNPRSCEWCWTPTCHPKTSNHWSAS